jgi:hypothetical protein
MYVSTIVGASKITRARITNSSLFCQFTALLNLRSLIFGLTSFGWLLTTTLTPCFWREYLLTYSLEQSPSWEANWFADSEEIPRVLWNPKVPHSMEQSTSWKANWFAASQEIPRVLWNPKVPDFMEQSPSWKANWFAASQEIPRVLWNPKVPHSMEQSPSWETVCS